MRPPAWLSQEKIAFGLSMRFLSYRLSYRCKTGPESRTAGSPRPLVMLPLVFGSLVHVFDDVGNDAEREECRRRDDPAVRAVVGLLGGAVAVPDGDRGDACDYREDPEELAHPNALRFITAATERLG